MFTLIFAIPLFAIATLVATRYVIEQMFLTNQDKRDMRDLRRAVDQCRAGKSTQACDAIGYTEQLLRDKRWCARYYPHGIEFRRCDQPWLFDFELLKEHGR